VAGSLAGFKGSDLGGIAIKGALERAGVSPDQVDYVIMGHVLQAGAGQITARQAAVKAGIGMDVAALTINKVCLSGLDAIALADQLIRAGEFEIVVAGGGEGVFRGQRFSHLHELRKIVFACSLRGQAGAANLPGVFHGGCALCLRTCCREHEEPR